jgi:hypothetical protein
MSRELEDALQTCLNLLQSGADIERCLALFPNLAEELQPLLRIANQIHSAAVTDVPQAAFIKTRSRLLNTAAEMRGEPKAKKVHLPFLGARTQPRQIPILASALAVLLVLILLAGTGLVRASSTSLPGDDLYPIKIGWEGLRINLTFDPQRRDSLEQEFENERYEELEELITENRLVEVDFKGQIISDVMGGWNVSGLTVVMTPDTHVEGFLAAGVNVRVRGVTQANGYILATEMRVLMEGGSNSTQENSGENESDEQNSGNSGTSSPGETESSQPFDQPTSTPSPDSNETGESFEIQGILTSREESIWTVNGKQIFVSSDAEIKGMVVTGAELRVKGAITSAGAWIAYEVEVRSAPTSPDGTSTPSGSGSGGDSSNPTPSPTEDH